MVYDNVQFIHGEAGTARTKSKADMQSTVQGLLHTQSYTEFSCGLMLWPMLKLVKNQQ